MRGVEESPSTCVGLKASDWPKVQLAFRAIKCSIYQGDALSPLLEPVKWTSGWPCPSPPASLLPAQSVLIVHVRQADCILAPPTPPYLSHAPSLPASAIARLPAITALQAPVAYMLLPPPAPVDPDSRADLGRHRRAATALSTSCLAASAAHLPALPMQHLRPSKPPAPPMRHSWPSKVSPTVPSLQFTWLAGGREEKRARADLSLLGSPPACILPPTWILRSCLALPARGGANQGARRYATWAPISPLPAAPSLCCPPACMLWLNAGCILYEWCNSHLAKTLSWAREGWLAEGRCRWTRASWLPPASRQSPAPAAAENPRRGQDAGCLACRLFRATWDRETGQEEGKLTSDKERGKEEGKGLREKEREGEREKERKKEREGGRENRGGEKEREKRERERAREKEGERKREKEREKEKEEGKRERERERERRDKKEKKEKRERKKKGGKKKGRKGIDKERGGGKEGTERKKEKKEERKRGGEEKSHGHQAMPTRSCDHQTMLTWSRDQQTMPTPSHTHKLSHAHRTGCYKI
ncbi:Pxr1, partial [Ophiophagus hannah]